MIPGPKSRALARRLQRVESRNITYLSPRFPVFWESASGATVRDADGNSFLDLSSAFGVSSLGHNPPAIRRAIIRQSGRMWHGMGDVHPNAVKVELLEALARIAPNPLTVAILSSTGAEAVESALKTARLFTGKRGVIAFSGAYHGLSYGTLGATDREDFKQPFRDQLPSWMTHAPFPDPLRGPSQEQCLQVLDRMVKQHPAGPFGALILEPIQGRGAVRIASPSFVRALRRLTRKHGMLLIADEVMTGLGRTGRTFAMQHAGVTPDLLCLGKALGNGFPISVCLGSPRVMKAWPSSDGEAIHTSTFLGNPLGCAMAVAALGEMKRLNLANRSESLGKSWLKDLQTRIGAHPNVGDIRGRGLMIGIELVKDRVTRLPDARRASDLVTRALGKRLILLSGGVDRNVITLLPPLTISLNELKRATQLIKELLYGKD